MSSTRTVESLAPIREGARAVHGVAGQSEPKVGIAEFISIAERFGFNDATLSRLRKAVSEVDLPKNGPHLGRYYGSAKPSMAERVEALACEAFQVKHAYTVCNGTAALTAALSAIGADPGTEVIVPATGFIATALAGATLGATPVFCDVDASLQMDPSKLEALVTDRTVAVIPTHHWGFVCDMAPILQIAKQHNIKVIEDCAQSPGATYRGCPVGSIGDVGCFSISCYKIIGGGEGGMVVTNDDLLYDRIRQASEAGGLWRPDRFAAPRYDGELFVGSNYRMSELEAAVNVVQMKKLPDIVARHRHVWHRIRRQLHDVEQIAWQKSNDPDGDIGYLLRCFPKDDKVGTSLAKALKAVGIHASYRGSNERPDWHVCNYYYPLMDRFPDQFGPNHCPVGFDLYNRCLTLELNQWWSDSDCDAVALGINKAIRACCAPIETEREVEER